MQHNIEHTISRMQARGLHYSIEELLLVSFACSEDTAVILGKIQSFEDSRFTDIVILIVRNRHPVTIMTRRSTQNFTVANFSVKKIIRLS